MKSLAVVVVLATPAIARPLHGSVGIGRKSKADAQSGGLPRRSRAARS